MPLRHVAAIAALLGGLSMHAWAQPTFSGYLCCNLRTDGNWASDGNHADSGKRILPVGTPVRVTGYGPHRVLIDVGGGKQAIGNDFSRDLEPADFAQRWVVRDDPKARIASFPPKIREAIQGARVTRGMTREQVAMAVGWPISSENPKLDADTWRMWLGKFAEYQVVFDKSGKVREIVTDPQTRTRVVAD